MPSSTCVTWILIVKIVLSILNKVNTIVQLNYDNLVTNAYTLVFIYIF